MGSDAAIEAADIVLMDDKPSKIAQAISISRRTLRIVRQNIWFALGVKAIVLVATVFGLSNMWEGIIADVGVSVIAILNASAPSKSEQVPFDTSRNRAVCAALFWAFSRGTSPSDLKHQKEPPAGGSFLRDGPRAGPAEAGGGLPRHGRFHHGGVLGPADEGRGRIHRRQPLHLPGLSLKIKGAPHSPVCAPDGWIWG